MSTPRQSASRQRATGFWQPELIGIVVLIAAMYVMPYVLVDDFLISKYSRYLVFGLLAMALSLSWGYAGILNLGQAVSFGLGSYCMAMALKLRTIPIQTGAAGLPDFMVWNNVDKLPWFWEPFHSYTFAIFAGVTVPRYCRLSDRLVCVSGAGQRRLRCDHHPRHAGCDQPPHYRSAKIYRRLQRHHRSHDVHYLIGIDFDAYTRSALYYLAAISLAVFLFLGLTLIKQQNRTDPAGHPRL